MLLVLSALFLSEKALRAQHQQMSSHHRSQGRRWDVSVDLGAAVQLIAIRSVNPTVACSCDSYICKHDLLLSVSKDEERDIFWDNLARLELLFMPTNGAKKMLPSTMLFRSLPRRWIEEYGRGKYAPALHKKLACFRNGVPPIDYLMKTYGHVDVREVTVSHNELQSSDEILENCVFADLYGSSLGVSTSQNTLENTAFRMASIFRARSARFQSQLSTYMFDKRSTRLPFLTLKIARKVLYGEETGPDTAEYRLMERALLLSHRERRSKNRRKAMIRKLNDMKWHPEGAALPQNGVKTLLARVYLGLSLMLSAVVGIVNIAKRDNVLERLFDSLQLLTFLWVGVFGLIKLTSEDQSILKHTLEGVIVVKTADDIVRLVRCGDRDELKQLLLETKTNAWLKPTEVSYALAPATGQIPLVGGLTVEKILECGHSVLGDRLLVLSDHEHKTFGRVITMADDSIFGTKYCVQIADGNHFLNVDAQLSIHDVIV